MTLVSAGRMFLPEPVVPGLSSASITATTHRVATLVYPPVSGSLSRVLVRISAVTTSAALRVRIESLGADGFPSGTLLGTGAEATIASPAANTLYDNILTTPVNVNTSQPFALVVDAPTGTPSMTISRLIGPQTMAAPQSVLFTTAWANASNGIQAVGGLYIDSAWRLTPGMHPALTTFSTTLSTNTTETGNRFTAPVSATVTGLWWSSNVAGAGPYEARLYNLSDTLLASSPAQTAAFQAGSTPAYAPFSSPVNIVAGTGYRMVVAPTTATTIAIRGYPMDPAQTAASPFAPLNAYRTSRSTSGGAWTDTTSDVIAIGMVASHVHDQGSSGRYKVLTASGWIDAS